MSLIFLPSLLANLLNKPNKVVEWIESNVKIKSPFIEGDLDFKLTHHQVNIIKHIESNPISVIGKSRQQGISTVLLAYVAHELINKPGSRILFSGHNNYIFRSIENILLLMLPPDQMRCCGDYWES
jgi:hypothetical protein